MSKKTPSSFRVGWVEAGEILETTFVGVPSPQIIRDAWSTMLKLCEPGPLPFWLIDASAVESLDGSGREVGKVILAEYVRLGGRGFYAVITSSVVRVITEAIIAAVGAQAVIVANRDDALRRIHAHRARTTRVESRA
jgi:hypothetical protein